MSKEIILDRAATERIRIGVNKIANAVAGTLGPRGENVIIERDSGEIIVTKDGVTVAREVFLPDEVENIGAQMIKKVAEKTVQGCGDGTTTSTVLAQAIYNAGIKNIAAGAHPMELKKGMDRAVTEVVKYLKSKAIPISHPSDIERIATISANNDVSIGGLIASAMEKVGPDGVITVEEGRSTETSVHFVEGLQLNRGFQSPHFINNPDKGLVEFDNPLILIYDKEIEVIKTLMPVLQIASKTGQPLVIVADSIKGEALSTLVANNYRKAIKVVCIGCPGFGEVRRPYLEDLAVITGGRYITEDQGLTLENVQLEHLGRADRIRVDKWQTTVIGGQGDRALIDQRVGVVKGELELSEIPQEQTWLRKRIASLTGGVAIISVGAASEVEMKERMDRIDDALHATQAAVEEGILPGGGVPLLRASKAVFMNTGLSDDQNTGIQIIKHAMEQPIRLICKDAPEGADVILRDLTFGQNPIFDYGYNPLTETYEEFYKTGIIDPARVIRLCLENATSIASLLLTSRTLIYKVKGEWSPLPPPPQMNLPR